MAQQAQGQGQGQGQQQAIAGDFGIDDSFNSERSVIFPHPGSADFPMLPPHFGGPNYKDHGPNFASIKSLLLYNDLFKIVWEDTPESKPAQAVIGLVRRFKFQRATNHDVDVRLQKLQHWQPGERAEKYPTIGVGFEKVDGEVRVIAQGTIVAEDEAVTSSMILVEALIQAYAAGGNWIHVISEGSEKELNSFGWGVGLSFTEATVSGSGDTGSIGTGGTGVSGGWSKYDSLPWMQFYILEVPVAATTQ